MFCCEEEIQPRLISTRCSSWYLTNECLAGSKMGSRWSCNILWPLQHLCTLFHVFLLHDGGVGTRISKVYLVEATHDKLANDSICGNLCSWHSTPVSNRLQISISIWLFHRSSCSLVFCTVCAILHQGISLRRNVQKTSIKGKYSTFNLICKLVFYYYVVHSRNINVNEFVYTFRLKVKAMVMSIIQMAQSKTEMLQYPPHLHTLTIPDLKKNVRNWYFN